MSSCNYVHARTSDEWLDEIKKIENKLDDILVTDKSGVKVVETDNDKVEYHTVTDTIDALNKRLIYAKTQYHLALEYEAQGKAVGGLTRFNRDCGY